MVKKTNESSLEMIAPISVTTDSRVNTRPVDSAWVDRKLKAGYDENRVAVPMVSMRKDGTLIWLDGQNRGTLAVKAGFGNKNICMKVFRGLTLAEEAELFLGLNDSRRVAPIYKFMAEVTAGHPEALEITRIAKQLGWRISDSGATNIHAVAALRKIYHLPGTPGVALQQTLSVATDSWGHVSDAVNANLLQGLASVLNTSPNINMQSLVKRLANHDGGPASLLGKGRGIRTATGVTVVEGVDQVIRVIYNMGRRTGKLNTWGPPAARSASSASSRVPA